MDLISTLRATAAGAADPAESVQRTDPFVLTDRVAVVTGAAGGIGAEVARVLGAWGAQVVVADRADLGDVERELGELGVAVTACPTDVGDKEAVDALAAHAIDRFGRLDIWVNAAGILRVGPILETDQATVTEVMRINFEGTFWGVAAAARKMARSGGSIVNISSGGADMAAPTMAMYGASKAAVGHLTRTAAFEFGPSAIRVNAIAPGIIDTPMISYHWTNPDGSIDPRKRIETLRQRSAMSPMGRVGAPSDVAYAVLYLASDAARFVTGQTLRPNGGVFMS